MKNIVNNKKAGFDYFIIDRYEAGIELFGTEIKSISQGKCSFNEAFVRMDSGEAYLYGFHVPPYENGNIWNRDPDRPKRLLLHKDEIRKLQMELKTKGYSIVPVRGYFLDNRKFKIEIALAKGKKLYDKRASLKEKDELLTARRENR